MLDAIILSGGKGTRLSGVIRDVPKPLAPVLGRPFLDHLLEFLQGSGAVRSVTLAVHHLAQRVVEHYTAQPSPVPLRIVRETVPLGTGGAIMNCLASVEGETFLCLNGDSLCGGDLLGLVAYHREAGAGITLGLVQVEDTARYGRAVVDDAGRVVEFSEKAASTGPGFINAGIYVIDRQALPVWNGGPLSMERDILPKLAAQGRLRGFPLSGPFIDIGLPETYAAVPEFLQQFTSKRVRGTA